MINFDYFLLGDKRFACVEWKGEKNKFSVIPMADFIKIKEDDEYEPDSYYKVKFGNEKFNARLVVIGNAFEKMLLKKELRF